MAPFATQMARLGTPAETKQFSGEAFVQGFAKGGDRFRMIGFTAKSHLETVRSWTAGELAPWKLREYVC